jgi:hypothetical protein
VSKTVTKVKPYEYNEKSRRHKIDGKSAPSVTQILGILEKPGLSWWGWKIACDGLAEAQSQGMGVPDDGREMQDMLKNMQFTPARSLSSAGDRGSIVHNAAEDWAKDGEVPNPANFAKEHRGYIQALAKWISDDEPQFLETEVVIASRKHGFVGKFDFLAEIGDHKVIGDYKTSKSIYKEAHLQLAAYKLASDEMGRDPVDNLIVIRLGEDGEYELAESKATGKDFLAVKSAFDAVKALEKAVKKS